MIDKVKNHIQKNKNYYIVGGVLVGAGITCLIMRPVVSGIPRVPTSDVPRVSENVSYIQPRVLNFFSRTGDITTNIHNGERGHPGFLTRCLETGDVFKSQAKAAEAFEVSSSVMSGHLNGKLDDVGGFHFERIAVI